MEDQMAYCERVFSALQSQAKERALLIPRHRAHLWASNCQHSVQARRKERQQRCWAEQRQRLLIPSLLLLPEMHPNPSSIWTATSPDSWVSSSFHAVYTVVPVPVLGLWVSDGIVAVRGSSIDLEWRKPHYKESTKHWKQTIHYGSKPWSGTLIRFDRDSESSVPTTAPPAARPESTPASNWTSRSDWS